MFGTVTDMITLAKARKMLKDQDREQARNPVERVHATPQPTDEMQEIIRSAVGAGSRRAEDAKEE